MPANTSLAGLPYPLSSEPVASGASNIQALAEALDTKVGKAIAFGAPGFGTVAAGAAPNVVLTFPASRFTSAPYVVATVNAVARVTISVTSVTTAQCQVNIYNDDSVSRPVSTFVLAVQPT